jgi:hypothetical protein
MTTFRQHSRQNLPLDLIALRHSAVGDQYPAQETIGPSAGLPPSLRPKEKEQVMASMIYFSPEQLEKLLIASWRRGRIITQPFLAQAVAASLLRPQEPRFYLFIQNQSAVNTLVVNFGRDAGAATIVPVDGVVIAANFGFYEPLMVSQDTISVRASGANTPGVLLYSTIPG